MLPLATAALSPARWLSVGVVLIAIVLLAALGAVGAATGRAPILKAVVRVTLLGVAAMLVTIAVGHLLGSVVV